MTKLLLAWMYYRLPIQSAACKAMHILSHHATAFVRRIYARFHDDHCLQLASSLTFTTLLALVPLLTVMLTVASAFPVLSGLFGNIDDFIASHVLPEQISRTVLRYVDQFSQRAGRLTLIGLGVLTAISFLTMLTIERAFNVIWRSRRSRPLVQKVVIYWAILTLGPVLIGASLTMTSYLVTASMGLAKAVPLIGILALWLVPVALTIAAFTLLYYIMPDYSVSLRHAFIGGITAGILFELAKRGFALYVSKVPAYTLVYGTFAAFPIFLLWIYLSWVVTLLGAVVTANLPEFGRPVESGQRLPGTDFCVILDMLRILSNGHAKGIGYAGGDLAILAGLTREQAENCLEMLKSAGWVVQAESGEWVLAREPGSITLSDIHQRFIFDANRLSARARSPLLSSVLSRYSIELDKIFFRLSVREFSDGYEHPSEGASLKIGQTKNRK